MPRFGAGSRLRQRHDHADVASRWLRCPECATRSLANARHCRVCGARLLPFRTSQEPVRATERHEREGSRVLVLRRDGVVVRRFALTDGETTVGRRPDSLICLADVSVSLDHALVIGGPDGFYLRDQGSINGTYVNRRRVEEGPLRHGDELQIGRYRLVYLE